MSIYIVDAMMGSGKTSAAIHMIRTAEQSAKYLFITPYLKEAERIIAQCPERKFRQPPVLGTKMRGIKHLLKRGENIVATHALFQLFDDEIIDLVCNWGYTLIMDEVTDVLEPLGASSQDMRMILRDYAAINPKTHLVDWHTPNYQGRFMDLKILCQAGSVGAYSDEIFIWMFPVKVFQAFAHTYLLTYMFNAQLQKYYYDHHKLQYTPLYVTNIGGAYVFTDNNPECDYKSFRELIRIMDKRSLNNIGKKDVALSKGWYVSHDDELDRLRKNTNNYFNNYLKTRSSQTLWTTFTDWKRELSGKGYTRGFAPHNARATNVYRNRTAVAYLINRYMNPVVRNFLYKFGITADENAFALCEMLQFVWRSAIRDGHPIDLYVPSKRMRTLLIDWLGSVEGGSAI